MIYPHLLFERNALRPMRQIPPETATIAARGRKGNCQDRKDNQRGTAAGAGVVRAQRRIGRTRDPPDRGCAIPIELWDHGNMSTNVDRPPAKSLNPLRALLP